MSAMRESDSTTAVNTATDTDTGSSSTTTSPSTVPAAADNSNLLCLDVCSGTGTIGICCAKSSMGHMIGVELCQAAVNDAVDNATLNGLTLFTNKDMKVEQESEKEGKSVRSNQYECGFICSRAEAVLESLIGSKKPKAGGVDLRPFQAMARGKKVLAVVDPPRGKVLCWLMLCGEEQMRHYIYVICKIHIVMVG